MKAFLMPTQEDQCIQKTDDERHGILWNDE